MAARNTFFSVRFTQLHSMTCHKRGENFEMRTKKNTREMFIDNLGESLNVALHCEVLAINISFITCESTAKSRRQLIHRSSYFKQSHFPDNHRSRLSNHRHAISITARNSILVEKNVLYATRKKRTHDLWMWFASGAGEMRRIHPSIKRTQCLSQ